ncbi:Acyl-coenzyme A synthetase ACSM3, mitochondrial [Orchesella cincta]|uniref:medium-chain acyl-CoA ligase n=1 Tax=Orchesella cincta TaxID=48709 RepID=A0A1D2NLG3_ORCCI|nr:Acyl-coenzyme A synthetase ACSM3, mitochondrial [Orchesella cincta]
MLNQTIVKNGLNSIKRKYSRALSQKVGELDLEEICRTGITPEKFNFAKDVFDWHAEQRPSAPALWFSNENGEDRIWTFDELRKETLKAGLVLQNLLNEPLSVGTSPFVLTVLPRIPEWWFLHMGAIRVGTIFCPGTTMLTSEDIQYRLEASSAHMIITDEENAEKVERAQQTILNSTSSSTCKKLKKVIVTNSTTDATPGDWVNYNKLSATISESDLLNFKHADTKSEDIAQAFFTSGTTGKPKMVAHVQSSYGIGHIETARQLGLKHDDVFWNISDPGWAKSSYSNFFAPWIAGSTVFIHQMKRFEAKPVLEALRTKPVTKLCAPPTLFRAMVAEANQSFQFKSLRYAVGAGEAVNPEVIRAWKELTGNIPLDQMYGQTEFTVLGCEIPGEDKQGSLGRPNGMYDAMIVDESGNEMPRGEEGVIAVRVKPTYPVGLFKGYLKPGPSGPEWDDEKNMQSFINNVYLTGDKGYMDKDGFIFFVGRSDDIINSAGYRIGPNEVESALQTHPAVVESAAVSSPDPQRGEVVKAFIVLNEQYRNVDKSQLTIEIQTHVKNTTAPYKYPRKIEFVNSLPKTVSGKILRRELKRQEFAKK